MKKIIMLTVLMTSLISFSQVKEFTTYDLKRVMDITQFKGAKRLKGYNQQKLNEFLNRIESNSGLLQQLNIDGWAICDYKNIDNFETYNYYYKKISRTIYNQYCKEINAIMILDDIIAQPK